MPRGIYRDIKRSDSQSSVEFGKEYLKDVENNPSNPSHLLEINDRECGYRDKEQTEGCFLSENKEENRKLEKESMQKYLSIEWKLLLLCFIHILRLPPAYGSDNSSLHCPSLQSHLSTFSEWAYSLIDDRLSNWFLS